MEMSVNDIENEIVSITTNNNFNNNGRYAAGRRVEILADELLRKMDMPIESRPFMCKAAWKLSEARLWGNVEQAKKGKNPAGLFIYLCKRDGV